MKAIIVVLAVLVTWPADRTVQQAPAAPAANSKNVETFENGKYSNEALGLKLDLPAGWKNDPEINDADNPRDLMTRFSSQFDRMFLAGSRLDPDEVLSDSFHWGLQGAIDGGGFKKVDQQIRETRDGHEVLSQSLTKESARAIYIAFFNQGYYVSILLLGPHKTEENRAAIAKSLKILPDVGK